MRFESLQDLKRELNGDPVVSRPLLRALGLGLRGGGGAVVAPAGRT